MRAFLLVFFAVACAGHHTPPEPPVPPEPPTPPVSTRSATIYLVSPEESAPGGAPMGCGESMVPVEISVSGDSARDQLQSVVDGLLSAEDRDGLTNALRGVFSASVQESDGALIVNLSGQPSFAGVCAVPRVKAPIEAAVAPYAAKLQLNGSEKDWRCLGDESGACQ